MLVRGVVERVLSWPPELRVLPLLVARVLVDDWPEPEFVLLFSTRLVCRCKVLVLLLDVFWALAGLDAVVFVGVASVAGLRVVFS